MANQEVNVYFKVEGLDGYITDLGDLKSALGQVDSATQDLADTQGDVERNFDNLDSKLETLEGGVKVLAGSLEIAAGALGALGIENEFFQEIEENVINIIALAEGAINVSEGFKLLAQNQKIAAVAQRAFNAAANANPYVLLASALIAAAGALVIWKLNAEDAVPATEDLADELDRITDEKNLTDIDSLIGRIDSLRKAAFGDDRSEVDNAIAVVAEVTAAIEASAERENQLLREASETESEFFQERLRNSQTYSDERIAKEIADKEARLAELEEEGETSIILEESLQALRTRQAIRAEQDLQFQLTSELESATEARDKIIADSTKAQDTFVVERVEAINYELEAVNLAVESWKQYYKLREEGDRKLAKSTTENVGTTTEAIDSFADEYFKAFNMVVEEPSKAAELLKRDFSSALSFVNDLNTIFTKDNEKRAERNFKIQKALSLSTAIVNTAEAITTALTDKTQPSTILRIAQTAAVAAAGAAQIATIARQKYSPTGGGNTPPPAVNAGASINYSFGQQAGSTIQPGQLSTGQQQQPVQTYVLASDVTNAQQAQAQIQNLARL